MSYPKTLKSKTFLILGGVAVLALALLPRAADRLSAYYSSYPYGNGSSGYNSSFTLASNNEFCVGQQPVYSITASNAWANQTIYWSSYHNGSMSSQTNFMLNGSGQWSASGNSWGSGDVGTWEKVAQINGVSQTLNFSVQNCGGFNSNPYSSSGFGGSVGGSSGGIIGGNVGNSGQTIGGSVGGSNGGTIGSGVNGSGNNFSGSSGNGIPAGSYIASNGYVCVPPNEFQQ